MSKIHAFLLAAAKTLAFAIVSLEQVELCAKSLLLQMEDAILSLTIPSFNTMEVTVAKPHAGTGMTFFAERPSPNLASFRSSALTTVWTPAKRATLAGSLWFHHLSRAYQRHISFTLSFETLNTWTFLATVRP